MNFQTFLQTAPEFDDFSNEELDLLEKTMRVDDYPAGHVFFEEDTPGTEIYLIVDGQVSVTHKRGKQHGWLEVKVLQPGEWFSLVSVLDSGKHVASCSAKTNVTVATLPKSAFNLLYNSNIELAHKIQRIVTSQVISDHRTLLSLIRKVMTDLEGPEDKQKLLQVIHLKYRGPERRAQGDRRTG